MSVIRFGCDKPGGRPLSDTSIAKIPPGDICTVRSERTGKTLRYRKAGSKTAALKERLKERIKGKEEALKTVRPGTKKEKSLKDTKERMQMKLDALKGKAKEVVKGVEKQAAEVYRRLDEISPDKILADPKRFQYKILGEQTKSGEVGSLSSIQKYDPIFAGMLLVWTDPENKNTYVVNGHNRLALAKRHGAEKVAVRFLEVNSAKEARAIGALANIAEGRGDGIDAAKFFRDSGLKKEALESFGIQLKDAVAAQGFALSNLPKLIFGLVAEGEVNKDLGVAIGGSGFSEEKQYRLFEMIKLQEKKGRRVTGDLVNEMVDLMKSSTTTTKKTQDLYGEVEEDEDYYFERANLQSFIKSKLSREKRLFGSAARGKDILERAGSSIEAGTSKLLASKANEYLKIFDHFKTEKELSKILDDGSKKVGRVGNRKDQRDKMNEIYEHVYSFLPGFIKSLGMKTSGQEELFA